MYSLNYNIKIYIAPRSVLNANFWQPNLYISHIFLLSNNPRYILACLSDECTVQCTSIKRSGVARLGVTPSIHMVSPQWRVTNVWVKQV
jgi:hypothetical protein